jgi:two-component system chemotaxis sensor kinase CheA
LLSDVTKQRALEKNLKQEQQIQKMIVVNAMHKKDVVELRNNFLLFLNSLESLFKNSDDMIQELIELKRNLHTFKGLFAQKEMLSITNTIHRIETEIENNTNIQTEISSIKERLEQAFIKDLNIIMDILGEDFFDCKDTVNIEVSKLDSIKSKLDEIATKCSIDTDKNLLIGLADEISAMKNQPLFDMLNVYPETVKNIASRLNKEIYPLDINGDRALCVPKNFKNFTDSLVHVFRNAIDHGIEDYKSREISGKDMIATISCSFKKTGNSIIINISDDGKGIDTKTVLHKALLLGLISEDEVSHTSKESILKLIFENNFTTNENVDDLSGRGIGLSSVKQILDKLNADVKITSTVNVGTKFTFILPLGQTETLENRDEETILNIIIDTSLSFLKNDTSIKILKTTNCEHSHINKNYSVLSFSGDIDIFCIVSIDDELLKNIFKLFVRDEISTEEREELLISFPDTVANTLVGRSIEKFPKKYSGLTMSAPLIIDRNILVSFEENNMSASKKIETSHGEFMCTIIKMED